MIPLIQNLLFYFSKVAHKGPFSPHNTPCKRAQRPKAMSICPRSQDASELTQCQLCRLLLYMPLRDAKTWVPMLQCGYPLHTTWFQFRPVQHPEQSIAVFLFPLIHCMWLWETWKKSHTSCIRPYNFILNNFNSTTMFYQYVITYIINKISTSIQKIKADIKDTVTFHNKLYNLVPENPFTIHSNINFKNIFQCSILEFMLFMLLLESDFFSVHSKQTICFLAFFFI